jgi:hypothetical protein
MIGIRLMPSRRAALIAVRLAMLVVPVATLVGCDDNDSGGKKPATATAAVTRTATAPPTNTAVVVPTNSAVPAPTNTAVPVPTTTATQPPTAASTATPTPNAASSAACDKLVQCGQCFINATGQCISTDACAGRVATDVAVCINGVNGCDPNTLGDCLFPGCDGNDATGECQ